MYLIRNLNDWKNERWQQYNTKRRKFFSIKKRTFKWSLQTDFKIVMLGGWMLSILMMEVLVFSAEDAVAIAVVGVDTVS